MNIYLFSYEFYNDDYTGLIDGGLATEYYKWAKQLLKIGHEVTIVSTSTGRTSKTIYEGIKVYEINPYKYCKTLNKFLYKINKSDLKTQISKGYFLFNQGIKLFLFFENLKKHIDIVQHASVVPIIDLNFIPCCTRIASYTKNYCEAYDIIPDTDLINAETQMFVRNKNIFGPSKCIANLIIKDLSLNKEIKIIETPFINNNITFDNKYYNELQDKKYILFFGSLGLLKGCFDLAEIIYDILDKNKDIYFVFVGKQVPWKNTNPVDYIIKQAREYSNRIKYYANMQHKYLFPIIQGANFCLMPSRTENFSNTCLEAMSFKKIVLGSSPFFNQIIVDGKTGFLCEAANPESLKNKIYQILSLQESERKIVENSAYKRVLECNIEAKTKELVKYYENLL